MGKKYILFDFDGVISNTEESNSNYLAKALEIHGIKLTEADKRSLIGTNDKNALDRILARGEEGLSRETFARTRSKVGNTYENSGIQPMPGLVPMIQELRKKGIKTAIASSTSTKFIIIALDRMNMMPLFDAIVCGDMCGKSKPNPQIYQKTMNFLGAEPEECVIIEDSAPGIEAGKRAGAYVIAYRGSGIKQDISGADCSVEDYGECWKQLSKML